MELEVCIKKILGEFKLDVSFSCSSLGMAILGASGCGKTMTLKCIAGIETPDEGRIILNGNVLFDSNRKINLCPQERRVGYLFQDYALFPNMTVAQNIEIAMGVGKADDYTLERFNLKEIKDLYPKQLSAGQKQRTAMARMLAAGPDLILLDEPFSALDSHNKWQMENEVKTVINENNIPYIFVSHNRDEVYRLCENTGIMADGKMKGTVNTKELFINPGTRHAAIVSGCKNVVKAIRTDTHRVLINEWGVELSTAAPVTFEEGFIGIRAHSFSINNLGLDDRNCINISDYTVTEEPFEWNISFRTSEVSSWIQWKVSKDILGNPDTDIPGKLWIKPEKIMLLEE